MRLSVIVTCTQSWPEVRGCLDRLAPQVRAGEVELIVADGSGRGLDATAAEHVRWLRFPGRGPHELRFLGLTEARGEVVAITEDHCDVAPDWCEYVLAAHARQPDAVAIAGPVRNGAAGRLMDRASFFLVHGQNLPENAGRPGHWFPPAGSNVSYKREQIMCSIQRPGDLELVVTPQLWAQGLLGFDEKVVVAHSQSLGIAEHVRNHFHSCGSSLPLRNQTLDSCHERPRDRGHRRLPRGHRRSWQQPPPASVTRAGRSGDDGT